MRRRHLSIALVGALVLSALILVGSFPGVAAAQAATEYSATIDGLVVSSSAALPVPGALVEFWELGSGGSWAMVAATATDQTGYFAVTRDSTTTPVRLRVADPTGMHDPGWYGGTDRASATDVYSGWDVASFVYVELPLRSGATVRGTVTSAYSGAPLPGVDVSLMLMADYTVALEGVTGSDGTYSLGGVPPGTYALLLDDPAGRYWSQWWRGSDTIDAATPITVAAPSTIAADPALEPVKTYPVSFNGWSSAGAGHPWVGDAVRMSAWVVDAPAYTVPVPADLTLEVSTDYTTWTRYTGPVAWDCDGRSEYGVTIVPTTTGVRWYRLRWAGSEFVEGAVSTPTYMSPESRVDLSRWSTLAVSPWPSSASLNPSRVPGYVIIEAMLYDRNGLEDAVSNAIVQSSKDGLNWQNVPSTWSVYQYAERPGGGRRRAWVSFSEATQFRLMSVEGTGTARLPSSAVRVYIQPEITLLASTQSVRGLRPFVLSGYLAPGRLGDPCVVEVRRPGSGRWSYSSARLVYRVLNGREGEWWYRYSPRLRGSYVFRARYAGGPRGLPCVSGRVTVRVR
jgi:hypothetical protein